MQTNIIYPIFALRMFLGYLTSYEHLTDLTPLNEGILYYLKNCDPMSLNYTPALIRVPISNIISLAIR
jgi:hypothetical protein